MLLLLAAVLLAGEARVVSDSRHVDAVATARALEIRLGARVERWHVEIVDREDGGLEVRIRGAQGEAYVRKLTLVGHTAEERSRELAAAIALTIESGADDAVSGARGARARDTSAQGWLALGARAAFGRPVDPDGGVTLRGGALWGRRHIQPIVVVGWSHAQVRGLKADLVRAGAGVAFGAAVPTIRGCFGVSAVSQLSWLWARERLSGSGGAWVVELTGFGLWRLLRHVRHCRVFAATPRLKRGCIPSPSTKCAIGGMQNVVARRFRLVRCSR